MILIIAGVLALSLAVYHERRMHRHRQPGVSYKDATLRVDGGWRNAALFTANGLAHQRKASTWGVLGALLLIIGLALVIIS